jgi:hypothetical protein
LGRPRRFLRPQLAFAPGLALLIIRLVLVTSDLLLLAAIVLLIAPFVARLVTE